MLAAAEWIKETGYIDPKKLILMGGSYGGYMTMVADFLKAHVPPADCSCSLNQ